MTRRIRPTRAAICAVAVVGSLIASVPALGSSSTTAPGQHALIGVTITDKRITVIGNATEARGVIATFLANNLGKKPHNFQLFGHKTKTLLPGHQARFTVTLTYRGAFPYKSTLDKGKAGFQGVFTVY